MFNMFLSLVTIIICKILTLTSNLFLKKLRHDELQCIEELRRAFQKIPVIEINNCHPSERSWIENMNYLRKLVIVNNPKEFLRWDVIQRTMFVSNAPYLIHEFIHLIKQEDWRRRWREAIRESTVGNPIPFWIYPRSSGNLVHHAYHLAQFEGSTGINIDNIGFVFEFGGGYGSMCRLFHNLGYKGKYLIYDLPAFSALQRSYLVSLGLPYHDASLFKSAKDGVSCISNHDELKYIIESINPGSALFISTWALSETTVSQRNSVLPMVYNFDYFLIAYQAQYLEMNNKELFNQWKIDISGIEWKEWEIKHMPGNYYLIGHS